MAKTRKKTAESLNKRQTLPDTIHITPAGKQAIINNGKANLTAWSESEVFWKFTFMQHEESYATNVHL